jgi:RHS repeat-associated protein
LDAQADAADAAADAADAAAAAEAAAEAAAIAAAVAAANKAAGLEAQAEDQEAEYEMEEQADEDAAAVASASAMMAATQAVADAAAMVLGSLMGKDPSVTPCWGLLLTGMPNVLVGGFPMPPWMAFARGLGKLLGLKRFKSAHKSTDEEPPDGNPVKCDGKGEPVNPVTGASFDDWIDYEAPGAIPFRWGRSYSSAHADRDGPMGRGFRHSYERTLHIDLDFATYTDAEGRPTAIPIPVRGEIVWRGYTLRMRDERALVVYTLDRTGEPTMEFVRDRGAGHEPRLTRLLAKNAETCFSYDGASRLSGMVETTASGVFETRLSYDPSGHVVEVRRGPHAARDLPLVAAYGYDARGCLVVFQDALGARSTFAYDAAGRMTSKIDPNGYGFHYTYDERGRCVESRGSDGRFHVTLAYDRAARRTTVTEVDGGEWIIEYDEAGIITSILDPYGGERRRVLDDAGRIVREVGPGPHDLRFLYDWTGKHYAVEDRFGRRRPPLDEQPRPSRDSDALRVPETPWEQQWGAVFGPAGDEGGTSPPEIQRERDALGRVTEEVDAHGRRRSFAYDAAGKLARWRDRDGRERRIEHASWHQVRATIDPLGHRTSYDYTMRSEVARVVDPCGSESRYEYDLKDRLVRVVRHGVLREEYVYDEGDGLIEKRDGAGNVLVRRTLDEKSGLPVERRLASGEVYRYEYDARGRATRIRSKSAEVRREHDGRGRLVRDERDGRGVRHRFLGDALVETTYFGRFVVRRSLAPDGALLIEAPVGGVQRLRRGAFGAVVADLGNGTRVTSTYDDEGRCLGRELRRTVQSGSIVWHVRYAYSAEGDLLRVQDSVRGTTDYAVDHAHRLVSETRPGGEIRPIVLDAAGNVRSKASLPPVELAEGNRLRAAGGEWFRYSARNHLEEQGTEGGVSVRYRYDANDMLVEVAWSDRREVWTAAYDGLRRRVHKALGGARIEEYWDDHRLAAEMGPRGALRIYVYPAPSALVPLMFVDYDGVGADPASGRAYYPIGNQIGLPLHVEDEEGRVVWQAEEVDPYGAISVRAGAKIAYALRFPGHFWDEETGLHYNRFRYYSPRLGRYLQSDPIGQSGGINLYAYATNPLVRVDVLGLADVHPRGNNAENGTDAENPPSFDEAKTQSFEEIDGAHNDLVDHNDDTQGVKDVKARLRKECADELRQLRESRDAAIVAGSDPELRSLAAEDLNGVTTRAAALRAHIRAEIEKVPGVVTPAYITEKRLPTDAETFLRGDEYTPTNYLVKGARVYKGPDGLYYYRDTLHKGADAEIEVCDAQGDHLRTVDPITRAPTGGPKKGRSIPGM